MKNKPNSNTTSKGHGSFKSSSLHSIHVEKPLCDSNKTKATFTESPPQNLPLEADLILALYDDRLSDFEKQELNEYKTSDDKFLIYHLGDIQSRNKHDNEEKKYDDESGDYIIEKGDIIYYRYEVISHIGKGSFGKVYLVYDHKENKEVALKILKSFPKEAIQIDLEPEILTYLK